MQKQSNEKRIMPANTPDTTRDFTPAEIVRIHEANCDLQFASADEQNFRIAVMKYLGRRLGLAELRGAALTGPGAGLRAGRGGAGA